MYDGHLTKKYDSGFKTLNAKMFPPITQETIDREIRSFEPFMRAVERLAMYEDTQRQYVNDYLFKGKEAAKTNEDMVKLVNLLFDGMYNERNTVMLAAGFPSDTGGGMNVKAKIKGNLQSAVTTLQGLIDVFLDMVPNKYIPNIKEQLTDFITEYKADEDRTD